MKVIHFYEKINDFSVERFGDGNNDFSVFKKGILITDSPLLLHDNTPQTIKFNNYIFYDFSIVSLDANKKVVPLTSPSKWGSK